MSSVEQILNLKFYKGTDPTYIDEEEENHLLELVESGRPIQEILMESEDPAILYNLSDMRENVLEWYDFDPDASLLEINSGCGALTGLFCRRMRRVVCCEPSRQSSVINAVRNQQHDNLEICVGELSNLSLDERFNYVTMIGACEHINHYKNGSASYTGSYNEKSESYANMLERASSFLKPDGKLIIAIENKFGLKYWSGAAEDHTGGFFDGIQNYNGAPEFRTFSKPELERLLHGVGFTDLQFYYPMPDYKLATSIYSDDFLPQKGMLNDLRPSYDRDRYIMFDQEAAYEALIQDGQFSYFANSFLIICSRK